MIDSIMLNSFNDKQIIFFINFLNIGQFLFFVKFVALSNIFVPKKIFFNIF